MEIGQLITLPSKGEELHNTDEQSQWTDWSSSEHVDRDPSYDRGFDRCTSLGVDFRCKPLEVSRRNLALTRPINQVFK